MAATVFQCPQCSQLNTTRRITCKDCGADLKQDLGGMKFREKVTLIIGIIVITIAFGVMSFKYFVEPMLMIPGKNPHVSPMWLASGVGSAIHATIQAKHLITLLMETNIP